MARIRSAVMIARPVEKVFDVVADERNEPTYNPALLSSEKVTDGPVGTDTSFKAVHAAGCRPIELDIEPTEFDRPRLIGSRTVPGRRGPGAVTFEPADGGATRMRWAWDVRPRGFARFLGPLVTVIGKRQERAMRGADSSTRPCARGLTPAGWAAGAGAARR